MSSYADEPVKAIDGRARMSHKRSLRFVVDGQQHLTTLTLLLIYLHNLQTDRPDQAVHPDRRVGLKSVAIGS